MTRTWGLCNSENLLNLSQETGYIKITRWIWKKQWEGWPWPWFCHFHLHTVDVPAGAGHHGMRENSPACETLQQFGLSDSWGLNFILLLLCIQFSQSVQIFTADSVDAVAEAEAPEALLAAEDTDVGFIQCRQESPQRQERAQSSTSQFSIFLPLISCCFSGKGSYLE